MLIAMLSLAPMLAGGDDRPSSVASATARVTLVKRAVPELLHDDAATLSPSVPQSLRASLAELALHTAGAGVFRVAVRHDAQDATGAPLPPGEAVLRIVLRSE